MKMKSLLLACTAFLTCTATSNARVEYYNDTNSPQTVTVFRETASYTFREKTTWTYQNIYEEWVKYFYAGYSDTDYTYEENYLNVENTILENAYQVSPQSSSTHIVQPYSWLVIPDSTETDVVDSIATSNFRYTSSESWVWESDGIKLIQRDELLLDTEHNFSEVTVSTAYWISL